LGILISGLVQTIGTIVAIGGLLTSKKWGLYLLVVFTIVSVIGNVLYWSTGALIFVIMDVVVLVYFWSVRSRST